MKKRGERREGREFESESLPQEEDPLPHSPLPIVRKSSMWIIMCVMRVDTPEEEVGRMMLLVTFQMEMEEDKFIAPFTF